ncbi:serine hydrolase [Flavobacterium sp. HSC-61S13]|uniref:serine hydrolase domain-containing protein n=1 Tax=Flavobacterium sp. HSC-61S13 TaxID=2910963 RepID=UPI0020A14D96|nr:serine hydrolase [Flavobacterium sp. HSC-61S13]MCP1994326.1 CubicO group peptidase (beta-lactamase class C family) [Flavobacterium sp. HSC-61S13]
MTFKNFIYSLLFISGTLCAQINTIELEENFQKIYKNSDFPGFAIGIVKNDSILFSKAYGFANVKENIPFTENTIMPIASVSKTVIALSLAKAMELGYFDTETPINEILPFKVLNPHHSNDIIKIKHLFTHTSGIIDNEVTFINSYQLTKRPEITLGVFLERCLSEKGQSYSQDNFDISETGSKYNYSNIASALAAYLIEVKSKMSFDEFTQKYIFEPLELESTHWLYDETRSKDYAKLYEINISDLPFYKNLMNDDKSVKTYSSIIYPDGSLKTSLNDLTKYVKEIINGYNNKSQILNKESYETIFKKRFEENNLPSNSNKNITNQAMFWSYNKKGRLTHTGSDPGVFAVISIDLKTNIGRIVLINANIDTDKNQKLLKDLKEISENLENIE